MNRARAFASPSRRTARTAPSEMRLCAGAAALLLAMYGGAASAQTAGAEDTGTTAAPAQQAAPVQPRQASLPTITVVGAGAAPGATPGFVAKKSSAGSKTDTPIIDIAQNISVVTRRQMDVQNPQSVGAALRYTSGINPEVRGTNNNTLEDLYARGFLIDEYWNGLHTPGPAGGFGYNVTSYDPYLLDSIEFLHGPASVLYGQGSPGGTVNLVSKLPTETPLHEIGIQTGNDGREQAFFDFSGPVDNDGALLYRLTGDGFKTDTQTDFVHQERFAIAPSLTWQPTAKTRFTIYAQYQSDPEAGGYNSVPAAGTLTSGGESIPRSFDPGDPHFDSYRKTQEAIGYMFQQELNDVWTFKQSYRYIHNTATMKYLQSDGYASDGTTIDRTPYLYQGSVASHTLDNQALATFNTGPLTHHVLLGVDYQHSTYDHTLNYSSAISPLSVENPDYGEPIPYPSTELASSGAETLKQLGFYGQDQIDLGHWSFIGGVRQDWAQELFNSYASTQTINQQQHDLTWRAGAVYKFDNGIAPYFSYSTSFDPQLGTTYSGSPYKPTKGKQFEAGIKYQPPGYNSFVTVSAFHIDETNVLTTDPDHTGFDVQSGQVRSQGFELEGHASLTNHLQLIASYTYTDLLNTDATDGLQDKTPVGIPRNTASVWADYTLHGSFLPGLQMGAGVRYVGGSYGSTDNTLRVPSATLLDAALNYDLGRSFQSLHGWTAWVNVTNLTNRRYISSCSATTFCTWGDARTILVGAKYQW